MVRPATLDRVENGGSGSDINPREPKAKGPNSTTELLFRPMIVQSAAVLEAVKARPGNVGVCLHGGATAGLDSFCARRRPEIYGRGGRKPAARSNKRKRRKQERKCLRSWRRLENEETAVRSNKETDEGEKMRCAAETP